MGEEAQEQKREPRKGRRASARPHGDRGRSRERTGQRRASARPRGDRSRSRGGTGQTVQTPEPRRPDVWYSVQRNAARATGDACPHVTGPSGQESGPARQERPAPGSPAHQGLSRGWFGGGGCRVSTTRTRRAEEKQSCSGGQGRATPATPRPGECLVASRTPAQAWAAHFRGG